jgi:hypothetical protein
VLAGQMLACRDKLRCTRVDEEQAAAAQPQRHSCVGRKTLMRWCRIAVANPPETKKRFQELGYIGTTDTPDAFATFLHEDIEKMAKLIRQYNLKPE